MFFYYLKSFKLLFFDKSVLTLLIGHKSFGATVGATEDSGEELSSCDSYEHLDRRGRRDVDELPGDDDERFVSALNDSRSLVSVTPDTDSLSTTSTSSCSVSDVAVSYTHLTLPTIYSV